MDSSALNDDVIRRAEGLEEAPSAAAKPAYTPQYHVTGQGVRYRAGGAMPSDNSGCRPCCTRAAALACVSSAARARARAATMLLLRPWRGLRRRPGLGPGADTCVSCPPRCRPAVDIPRHVQAPA